MDPTEWMSRFRLTHEQAKRQQLGPKEHETYLAMREELAKSLVSAQSLQVPEEKNYRKVFRVAQMYKIEINGIYQTMTTSVSRSGFAANLAAEMKIGQVAKFALTLGRRGRARDG